jgi:hypothetical protein
LSRALFLLIALRIMAGWRNFWRSGRGSVVAWLGKLYILLILLGAAIAWASAVWCSSFFWHNLKSSPDDLLSAQLWSIIRAVTDVAPLLLLVSLLLTVGFSLFAGPIVFNPAEVDFLCAGPFRRRQLVNYKIGAALEGQALMSFLVAAPSGATLSRRLAVFLGSLLLFNFFQLVSLVASQSGALLGLQDARGLRRLGIVLGTFFAALALVWGRFGITFRDVMAIAGQLERSNVWRPATSQLRWFIEVMLADRVWPDLVKWSGLCVLVNSFLFMIVHLLDARLHARQEDEDVRATADENGMEEIGAAAPERAPRALPLFARCQGLGPVAWRQGMDVLRRPERIAFAVIMYAVLIFLLFALTRGGRELLFIPTFDGRTEINTSGATLCGIMAILLTTFIALGLSFDFRADIGQIDVLKVLPIEPIILTAGQLLVPVVLAALMQWLALAVLAIGLRSLPSGIVIASAFVPLSSLVLMSIENLATFWFPMRQTPGVKPEPFEQFGHVLIYPLVRMVCYCAALVAIGVVATGAYFVFGQSAVASLAAAWLTLAVGGAGLVFLLSRAFDEFDVARCIGA